MQAVVVNMAEFNRQRANTEALSASDLSRRGFLGAAAAVAASGSWTGVARALAQGGPLSNLSRVVRAHSPLVLEGASVRRTVLAEMLERSLTSLAGAKSTRDAWRSILSPRDVVGIKFNRSGQAGLGTTPTLADALIVSLHDAGWSPEQIVCIEAPSDTVSRFGTQLMVEGYAPRETDFGSGSDRFAAVLDQVTALISVPFLKTHNIATMTCSMKNLSHGLIKHPGRYHAGGCCPFIPDIVAASPIRSKLKLCMVDALRVVHDGGPNVVIGGVKDAGFLLASRDPVAVDSVGFAMLGDLRLKEGLSPLRFPTPERNYLRLAADKGLGVSEWHQIDLVDVTA